MKKQMKFLICGFGNCGQRHFRNLKTLLLDCEIDIVCSTKTNYRIFDNELNISYTNNLKEIYDINEIYHDLDEALLNKYDASFVCSLPPKRINMSIVLAEQGINLFIEKPLSNNLDQVYKLQEIVEEKGLICTFGFQMRFHPVFQKLKNMIDNKEFGEIYRIESLHSNNIHNWTKGRELSNFYALKSEKGGGALLSQIHEIDYLTYLFGKHYPISAIYGNWLNTEVEDNITILSNLESEDRCIPIIINLDFLSPIPRRDLTIYGMNKTESFNLLPHSSEEWNNLFLDEMKAFLNLLDVEKDSRLATLEDGISSLEYCMDIKDNFMKVNYENKSS